MSDAILVAIIAGGFNIVAVVLGRLLSRHEHKKTAAAVLEIKGLLNGHNPTADKQL